MPRLPDDFADIAFYLYPSSKAAEEGADAGGTGFIVFRPMERLQGQCAICLITNKHVVQQGHTFVRLARQDGAKPDIFEVDPVEWYPHPGPHDVTVALGLGNPSVHKLGRSVFYWQLMSREMKREYDVGLGDDVFMIGRFIGHDGKTHNRPSIRFGNLSIDVGPIFNRVTGLPEESFAVEVKSKPGYSGSAVFVYRFPGGTVRKSVHKDFVLCLGINWGHILEKRQVLDADGHPVKPPQYVHVPSDMSGVVPAWCIKELLDSEPVLNGIRMMEDETLKEMINSPVATRATISASKGPQASDENPNH
jgi:hypothetical protein